ncbi:MAG: S-layer homology domain-containing protein [Dialister pneumosintes]
MKKILAIAAVAALTAGVSAYAANPFSDVSTSDWAYQAVSELSDQGIVEGYPDGTFKGERNITRYELAQIIARLMANEDQYNAEQRAMIDQLASEYADELNNLGVRVGNLESKVGNISWSGDAYMKWAQGYSDDAAKTVDNYKGRLRIKAHAQVNDSTYVEGLLRGNMNFKDDKNSDVYLQRLYVHHDFGNRVGVNLGKYAQSFGQTGMFFDGEIKGAEVMFNMPGMADLTVGYGRVSDLAEDVDFTYAKLAGDLVQGRVAYDVEYIKSHGNEDTNIWGAGLTLGVTDKIDVFGDYYKNTKDVIGNGKKPVAWTAGIGFGRQDMARPGSFRVSAAYVNAKAGAVTQGYTYDVSPIELLGGAHGIDHVKYWTAAADVTVAKNVSLHGEYAFNVKSNDDSKDLKDLATVSLNYAF